MKRSPALLFTFAGAWVALDQGTKFWAGRRLAYAEPIHVIGDLVRLTYARNSGIAFGMLSGHGFPLYVFSIIASIAVLALFFRHPRLSLARHLSLALILGGAIGNLIDRTRTGEVVDFILLAWGPHEFPVFNVADVGVTCGVILFALVWSGEPERSPAAPNDEAHGQAPGSDGAAGGGGPAGGPLGGEGPDRPVA